MIPKCTAKTAVRVSSKGFCGSGEPAGQGFSLFDSMLKSKIVEAGYFTMLPMFSKGNGYAT